MPQPLPNLHIVLLCEDYGSRLWPIAREQSPSCFMPLSPHSTDTLFTATVKRFKPYSGAPIHVVTTEQMAESVAAELRTRAGLKPSEFEILKEPAARSSAFAIALACARIRLQNPNAVVAVFPSDQRTVDDERWENIIFRAYQTALRDRLVLLGAQQEERCAADSFIRKGRPLEGIEGVFDVRHFAADVTPAAAKRACDEGALWHTGIIIARAAVVLGELTRAGEQSQTTETSSSHRITETANFFAQLDSRLWLSDDARRVAGALPVISFEKAALEVSEKLAVVPITVPISALTTLRDLDNLAESDKAANRVVDDCGLAVDSHSVTLYSEVPQREIVTFGLRDVTVVDTPDALLVAQKERLRSLDDVLAALREAKVPQLTSSLSRSFAWGTALLVDAQDSYATWRIELRPGASLASLSIPTEIGSFQPDTFSETYTVVQGSVEAADKIYEIGNSFAISNTARDIRCTSEESALLILSACLKDE